MEGPSFAGNSRSTALRTAASVAMVRSPTGSTRTPSGVLVMVTVVGGIDLLADIALCFLLDARAALES